MTKAPEGKRVDLVGTREHKQLARAGQGAPGKFWYTAHQELQDVLLFRMPTLWRYWDR